jgi:hypothetical protein
MDPASRLLAELSYLLDSSPSEIACAYVILTEMADEQPLIEFSKRLSPISRANFLAHVAALGPVGSEAHYALVEVHASLDTESIYAKLKEVRTKAGLVAPPLLSVNQSLQQLLHIHTRAIVAGYDNVDDLQRTTTLSNGRDEDGNDAPTIAVLQKPANRRRWTTIVATIAGGLILALVTSIYLRLENKLRGAGAPPHLAVAPSAASDPETAPPVGTGQHLGLDGVRYCHYQEERLRLMKPDVLGPEAIRAFNLLAVDYNSRCSDFFYRESDLATVKAEIAANHRRLAADAKRIISSWSDHPDQPTVDGKGDIR